VSAQAHHQTPLLPRAAISRSPTLLKLSRNKSQSLKLVRKSIRLRVLFANALDCLGRLAWSWCCQLEQIRICADTDSARRASAQGLGPLSANNTKTSGVRVLGLGGLGCRGCSHKPVYNHAAWFHRSKLPSQSSRITRFGCNSEQREPSNQPGP
jgi:hypothetical protein